MADIDKARENTVKKIAKKYGRGIITKLDAAPDLSIERIPTGSLALDIAFGGGVPRSRFTEIFGPDSSGKTTLAYHIAAEAQKEGDWVAFIDTEHVMDPEYAAACGIDFDRVYIVQPEYGEMALEIAEDLIRSESFGVIIVDSVAALVPRAEVEGEMGDSHMGLMARLMSQALRKLAGPIKKTRTAMVFTNQLRMKIGVVFGNPEVTPGGKALPFYASLRIDLRRKQAIKDGDEVVGNQVKAYTKKNKTAPPFRTAFFNIVYGKGIDREREIIPLAESYGLVERQGSWYYLASTELRDRLALGQGAEKALEKIEELDLMADLVSRIRVCAGLPHEEEKTDG